MTLKVIFIKYTGTQVLNFFLLESYKYKNVLFFFNTRVWNRPKQVISIVKDEKEFLLLFDLSNSVEKKHAILFVIFSKSIISEEKNLTSSLIYVNIFSIIFLINLSN